MKCQTILFKLLWVFSVSYTGIAQATCSFITTSMEAASAPTPYAQCDYTAFKVMAYCPYKLSLVSWTKISKDTGDEDTSSRHYKVDPHAAALNCQQASGATYSSIQQGYDVGHLTAIDLLDDNKEAALETNYMTNLVPQNSSLNRHGAWRKTERLTECYREEYTETKIFSGVLVGSNTENDHFISSHGLLKTPDRFWKLIKFKISETESEYVAWIFDNSASGSRQSLEEISTSVEALIDVMNSDVEDIYQPVIALLKEQVPPNSPQISLSFNHRCHSRNG